MVEVLSPATHSLMRPGQQGDRLAPAMAALLTSGYSALRRFERAFGFAIPARLEDARAIGEGGERFYAKINPSLLPGGRQGLRRNVGTGEADIPAVSLFGDRHCLGRALQGARLVHGNPANLR